MEQQYNKQDIYECMKHSVETYISEIHLKEWALKSLRYKSKELVFSKVTFSHFAIWGKQVNSEDKIKIMASVEFFVLACDILDDLQDQDTTDVPWMEIENKYAMNLFFSFLTLSKVCIQNTSFSSRQKLALLQIFSTYEIKSIMGQNEDLQKKSLTEEEYLHMIEKKSGSFMALACLFGSITASEEKRDMISQYAIHIGCSAQIENDLTGITERKGYKDIFAKEISLPIIYWFNFEKNQFPPLQDYYNNDINKNQLFEHLEGLKEYIKTSGAIPYSRTMQLIQLQKGLSLIKNTYENEEDCNTIQEAFLKVREK